ncbi:hypothetical protein CLAIMM_13593 isoform 1 [Cladophialophora immunda]|nr:hypothetical protein CLAIMM_13593 isoform 1 [Cladophialophora immunda]
MAAITTITQQASCPAQKLRTTSNHPQLKRLAVDDPSTTCAKVVELIRRDGGVVITGLADKDIVTRIRKELKPVFETDIPDESGFFPTTTRRATGLLGVSDGCVDLATNKLWIDAANEILTSTCRPWYGEKRAHFVSKPILAGTFGFQIAPGSRQQDLHRDDSQRLSLFPVMIGCFVAAKLLGAPFKSSLRPGLFSFSFLCVLYMVDLSSIPLIPIDMAASIAKQDTGGAQKYHDKAGRQQAKLDRSSRKRNYSARNKGEEENPTDHRRKSRRTQESTDHLRPQNSRVNSKISHKGPRSQEKQAGNYERSARGGQRRPSQRPAVKQYPREIPPPFLSQPARIKRKRSHDAQAAEVDDSQHERLAKQLRRSTPPRLEHSERRTAFNTVFKTSPPKDQLSENNLRIFNGEMNPAADNASVLKRTSSRRSIVPSEEDTVRSQRSSNTNAFYRHKHLQAVQIHIHAEPPDYIEAAANRIVNARVSKQRRAELRVVAQGLSDDCLKNVRAQSGEDDFINPLHTALKALGLKNLCLHEKAEWREELKLILDRESASSSSLESNTMLPPAPPVPEKEGDRYPIKNPRPDLSIGTDLTALVSALSAQKLNKAKATVFIDWLQNEMVQHEPEGPLEPMLLLVPAVRALDLAFPFAVVEGKAYSTGKQIFEAENQAAVSGAYALKIQLDLDSLVNSGAIRSGALPTSSNTHPPLFFSITTQGPIHELWLWYHWTVYDDGVRKFESKLLDSCNALVLERGEDFVVKLNNVGNWGTGPFVKSLVERLGKVAVKAET